MLRDVGTALAATRHIEDALRLVVELGAHEVPCRGMSAYRLNAASLPTASAARGLPSRFLKEYERYGRADDVLMHALEQRRTAVTEADAGAGTTVCSQWDMGRVLIVPLFGATGISGSLNFVRPSGAPPFAASHQLIALSLAAQTSVALARVQDVAPPDVLLALTSREKELLRWLAAGLRNREIAERCCLSEHAVHQALKRLYAKLGVHSRAAAVAQLLT